MQKQTRIHLGRGLVSRPGKTAGLMPRLYSSKVISILFLGCLLLQNACTDPAQDRQRLAEDLLLVAEQGDRSALDALLERDVDADTRDICDWTPLMKAAVNGHTDVVRRLLEAGADVESKDEGGYTSLLLAASNNHTDIVELLLDHGAYIDAQEQTQGFTALIWAAQRGHRQTVELLLARGADPTLTDFQGRAATDVSPTEGL